MIGRDDRRFQDRIHQLGRRRNQAVGVTARRRAGRIRYVFHELQGLLRLGIDIALGSSGGYGLRVRLASGARHPVY